jgi:hypothetical protein
MSFFYNGRPVGSLFDKRQFTQINEENEKNGFAPHSSGAVPRGDSGPSRLPQRDVYDFS